MAENEEKQARNPKRVLLIQLRQLGDILLTTPCATAIKRHFPDSQVSFLCHPMGKKILGGHPDIDHILTYPPDRRWWQSSALIKEMRSQQFDVAFDFMNNPRSALYCLLSGAKVRVSYQSRRRFFYHRVCKLDRGQQYIVNEKLLLLKEIGLDERDLAMRLHLAPSDRALGDSYQQTQGAWLKAALKVILSPTHRRPSRRWPLARYAALADHLVQKYGAFVSWAWGPGEEDTIEEVISMCQTKTYKIPRTSLKELADLISRHDLFIGNSNGPSHLAVAMNVPNIQLHGPTSATAWSPMRGYHFALQGPGNDISNISLSDVNGIIEENISQILPT